MLEVHPGLALGEAQPDAFRLRLGKLKYLGGAAPGRILSIFSVCVCVSTFSLYFSVCVRVGAFALYLVCGGAFALYLVCVGAFALYLVCVGAH